MKALGLSKTRKQVEEIMEVADRDGSGQIDIDEFKGLMASMIKERPVEAEFRKAFKRYDVEDMGMIDYDSLYTAAHKLEDEAKAKKDKHFEPVNDLEIRWMLKLADRSGKGLNQVTFEDFLNIMDKCGLISESQKGPKMGFADMSASASVSALGSARPDSQLKMMESNPAPTVQFQHNQVPENALQ